MLIDAYRKVIIVEDKSDKQYLRLWMSRILGTDRYRRIQRRLVFCTLKAAPPEKMWSRCCARLNKRIAAKDL